MICNNMIRKNNEKAQRKIFERFIKGLKEYNLTFEEITNGDWKYFGGDNGNHYRYFQMAKNEKDNLPEHEDECVCGVKIKHNCYITNGKEILILGSCCIKRFMPPDCSGRTCEICGKPHRNRINNRCNDCRIGICNDCGKAISKSYAKCYHCQFN